MAESEQVLPWNGTSKGGNVAYAVSKWLQIIRHY